MTELRTDYQILLASVVAVWCGFWAWSKYDMRRRNPSGLPYPPGPKGLPLIGNALDLPRSYAWLKAIEWRKTYGSFNIIHFPFPLYYPLSLRRCLSVYFAFTGDLVFLQMFGQNLLFVNSYEAATDLMDKKSLIYSSRPTFTMMNELYVNALLNYSTTFTNRTQLSTTIYIIYQAKLGLAYD